MMLSQMQVEATPWNRMVTINRYSIGHAQMCLDANVIAWVHKQLEKACPA
jgi:hypothetical protein